VAADTPLPGLIEAMAGAVIDAQDRIERRQMAYLSEYFDEDNRPKSIVIRMPSMQQGAQVEDEDLYRAPLLPLVSTNLLRIKDVEISFDADLGHLVEPTPVAQVTPPCETGPGWELRREATRPVLQLDTTAASGGRKTGSVHVVMRVEGSEPSDGMSRLMTHLAQTQGVFQTFRPES
jgi:hypothetical protein